MRDRPRDRIDVVLTESHEFEQGVGRGHDAGVRMAGALGVGGGARRVVDPTGPSIDGAGDRVELLGSAVGKLSPIGDPRVPSSCRSISITSKPPEVASSRAMAPCGKPRHSSGTMSSSVPTCWVMNDTSRSRRIGINGFWTAPIRDSATRSTDGFNRRWQLPGDHRVGSDPPTRERSGGSFRRVAELDSVSTTGRDRRTPRARPVVPWPLERRAPRTSAAASTPSSSPIAAEAERPRGVHDDQRPATSGSPSKMRSILSLR